MAKLTPDGKQMRRRSVESHRKPMESVPAIALQCDLGITRQKVLQELSDLKLKLPFTNLMRLS